jgi:hypothetical protein
VVDRVIVRGAAAEGDAAALAAERASTGRIAKVKMMA